MNFRLFSIKLHLANILKGELYVKLQVKEKDLW